jgi:hypothetical protein
VWICLSVSIKRTKQTHIITFARVELVKRGLYLEEEEKLG